MMRFFLRREEPSAEFRNGGKLNAHRGYPENNEIVHQFQGGKGSLESSFRGDPTFF